MKLLHNLTFKRKLMVLTLVTTTFALLLAGVVLVAYEIRTFREGIVNDVSAQAKILANLSAAQLAFNDPVAATEMLNELRHEPYVVAAVLFDDEGKFFATYQRDAAPPAIFPRGANAGEGHDFIAGHLRLQRTVLKNGQPIGSVSIVADMQKLYARLRQYVGIVVSVLFASVLLALWFSSVLQRAISQPILQLSGTARGIAENKDFSLRAAKFGTDEIGVFTDAFNQMLAQIQAQDGALQAAHQQLARQVEALQSEIQERRRVEGALQASEERFRSLFEHAAVGIYRTTPEGRVQLANPALLQMLGFTSLAELSALDLATEGYTRGHSRTEFVERVEREGEIKAFESVWRRKDGSAIFVSEYARAVRAPDGHTLFYEGTVEDITERKRNETSKAALSLLGQTLSATSDAKAAAKLIAEVADSLVGWDACTLDLYAPAEDKVYALVNIDLIEDRRRDVVPAHTDKPPTPQARRILTRGAELILRQPPYTSGPDLTPFGDRSRPSASLIYVPVRDGAKAVGVLSIQSYRPQAYTTEDLETLQALADLCGGALERIQIEEKLRKSQQKFEILVNSINGIVWERSPKTLHFTFVSRQSDLLLGYPPERWLDDPHFWQERLHPDDARAAIQASHDAIAAGQAYQFDYRMVAATGRVAWIRESGVILAENGRPVAVRGIFLDITEQKRAAEELDHLNSRLIETSHLAGMAEVATGVLHNVGNVLNSVNVSCTIVLDGLRQSQLNNLPKLAAMLEQQDGRLAEFFTQDPKGKQIPGFLSLLARVLVEEQSGMLQELCSLRDKIDHIKEIVAMQQSYAGKSGVIETTFADQLLEDAVKLNAGSLVRHDVQVERQFEKVPPICTNKHMVRQILLNLIRNALHACDEGRREPKRITLRICSPGPGRVAIQVIDNGIGILPENLTRIFSHGFTTRKDGHGFGLHSGALAARELGGQLTAQSDGPGTGAVFTLDLPLQSGQSGDPAQGP